MNTHQPPIASTRHGRALRAAVFLVLSYAFIFVNGLPEEGVFPAAAATSSLGGINVEPAARPWRYVGANPDSWWCPSASTCTTSNPLGRIDTELSLAHQLNVANVRLEIPWFLVEPSKGGYDWTRADYIFNSAASHGVVIQPILVYTPAWDGGYNAFPVAADFQAFVAAFMARYGGRINAVEMWNEPDGGQSLVANNPAQYVQSILIPGYKAVKAARPSVSVIEGGSINDSGVCCAWLSGVYNAGGGAYFDIAAFHDYGGNYAQIVSQYQGVINAHISQGNKPVWLGEYGVSDATGSQQSSLIQAALTGTPGLAMAQFYTLRDESVYLCCPPAATGEHKLYGVVAADDVTKKSSFYTMQSLLGGTPAPSPSTAPAPSPAPTTDPKVSPSASPSAGDSHPSSPGARPSAGHPSGSPSQRPSAGGASSGPSQGPSPVRANDSPIALPTRVAGAIKGGGTEFVGFALLLVGALGLLLGIALAMVRKVPAVDAPSWRRSILLRAHSLGFGLAAAGAVLFLLGVVLMGLPGSR